MLHIFLIGATLSQPRPEPQSNQTVPADPMRVVRRLWRTSIGVAVFWR